VITCVARSTAATAFDILQRKRDCQQANQDQQRTNIPYDTKTENKEHVTELKSSQEST
jgi:hypothetical protein